MPNPNIAEAGKETQFKVGDDPRRNVTGLNHGVRWSKNVIAEHLQTVIKHKNDLTGTEEEKQVYDHIIVKAIADALAGNTKSLKELLDRLEGTPTQTINQNIVGEKNKPINEWVDTPNEKKENETQ